MIRLIADGLISLPFTLDFCAKGPDVDPLRCELWEHRVTLYFPPSMSDGTDGQGVFVEWAWWTGRSLRIILERDVESVDDVDTLREDALRTGNEVLRRFLNAYRWRMQRPEVHPVMIDARNLDLKAVGEDGDTFELTEPFSAFFYKKMPTSPPLEKSVNETTLAMLQEDVQEGRDVPLAEQLALDAALLEAQGEAARADFIRENITRQSS